MLTHRTTLATLLALAIFGGEVIRPFALVMFFGVFTGTFSSIFIAAPVLLWIEHKWPGAGSPRRRRSAAGGPDAGSRRRRCRPALTVLVDTHCHLADPAFDADRARCCSGRGSRCRHIVVIGESPAAADGGTRAGAAPTRGSRPPPGSTRTTPGTGPTSRPTGWPGRLADPRVVAAGEIGLDYHYDYSPRDAQRAVFRGQLALAADAGAARSIIHAREADDDVAAVLRSYPRTPVVLHSFSQRPGPLAGRRSTWGTMSPSAAWSPSGTGRSTTPSAPCPLDRLLVETDGPTWRRCRTGASGTSRRSCATRRNGWPPSGVSTPRS